MPLPPYPKSKNILSLSGQLPIKGSPSFVVLKRESKKEACEAKTEQLKKEIMDFVNAKVNRFSRISEVVEEKEDFIKTPTHKIKRFLYNKNKNGQTPDQPAAGK